MKKELYTLIEQGVETDLFFIVELKINQIGQIPRIKLLVDKDPRVSIDECAALSRKLIKLIEDSKLIENFELEVGSPGIGEPLKLERQYVNNVGRLIKITTLENEIKSGKLLKVLSADKIIIEEQVKGIQKKTEIRETEIPFQNIKKAVIEVSFN